MSDEREDVSTRKLMQVTLIKYWDSKRSEKWQEPSQEEEQNIALTAKIGELQKSKTLCR
jgi:hypothetical protein